MNATKSPRGRTPLSRYRQDLAWYRASLAEHFRADPTYQAEALQRFKRSVWPKVKAGFARRANTSGKSARRQTPSNQIPPKPSWVTAYSAEIGYPMDGKAWCECYARKRWMAGKTPMTNWRLQVRKWKANRWKIDAG